MTKVLLSLALASILLTWSCLPGNVKLPEITTDGQGTTIKTGDGSISVNTKVPDAFPKDVLVYPGATILGNVTTPQSVTIMIETPDTVDMVAAAYKKNLTDGGWTQAMEMNQGGSLLASYTKAKRSVQITGGSVDNKTQLSIVTTDDKDK